MPRSGVAAATGGFAFVVGGGAVVLCFVGRYVRDAWVCINCFRALSYGTIVPSVPVNSEYTRVTVKKPRTGFVFVAGWDTMIAGFATGMNGGPGWFLA